MKYSIKSVYSIFIVLIFTMSFVGTSIQAGNTVYAQSNLPAQRGSGLAEQLIGQAQSSTQDSICASGDETLASCNNLAFSLNCNSDNGDECSTGGNIPNPPTEMAQLTIIKNVECNSAEGQPSGGPFVII
jgi:hypothetical protein